MARGAKRISASDLARAIVQTDDECCSAQPEYDTWPTGDAKDEFAP